MNLKDKTVLVTGSSRGIGREIAIAFGQSGCRVVLNASKSQEQLEETKAFLEEQNIPVQAFLCDISDYEKCRSMFQNIAESWGSVDILVNNAGISHIGLFTDMSPAEWKRILSVNLEGAFNCSHLAIPGMVRRKNGVILNISSIWGECGASCEAVYSASKGGLNAFTKAMAKELGPSNVRVNAISCGVMDTEMNACFSPEELQALTEEIPLMRFGSPKDAAALAIFLAGPGAGFLTGKILTLDGGML